MDVPEFYIHMDFLSISCEVSDGSLLHISLLFNPMRVMFDIVHSERSETKIKSTSLPMSVRPIGQAGAPYSSGQVAVRSTSLSLAHLFMVKNYYTIAYRNCQEGKKVLEKRLTAQDFTHENVVSKAIDTT